MKYNSFLTIVYIKVICHNVFTKNKTVSESLDSHISQNLIVILVA